MNKLKASQHDKLEPNINLNNLQLIAFALKHFKSHTLTFTSLKKNINKSKHKQLNKHTIHESILSLT